MEINKDTFFNYGFYSFTTTNADVFESLKFVKSTNPLNCDETIYGFADGRVFEVLGSKLPARASYINQLFGNELKNYYLREIHVYLLPLARLVAEPGLTLEEMFADFPDMLNYAYSPRMIQKFCTSKDGGDHLFAKENAVGEWYQSMTLEMLLNKFSSFDKNPASLLDYFESCFFEFMRFVPVQYHERIPYKVRENESKKRPLEYVHEPKVEKIVKPPPPKRSRTMVKPEASRGTKSITSFFSPKIVMSGPVIASRIVRTARGLSQPTAYGKRIDRLSNRIFSEVVRPTDVRSHKVVRVMSAEPMELREDKSVNYFPNLPMFHYLTKMLRFHGLFFDDHVVWRRVQDELKVLRGKVVHPVIGQGKRAQLRGGKK